MSDSPQRPDNGSEATGLPLIAYALPDTAPGAQPIVPAGPSRTWIRETHKQFAARCLPLLMANQSGWFLLNRYPLQVEWDGGSGPGALKIRYLEDPPAMPTVLSIFGCGILTWSVEYLFRTPPGYNLLVRGPSNMPKDGIAALEGVVETDWAVATFTMNWKLTRPDHPVRFDAGEPFCMIVPQRRYELERFEPHTAPIKQERELYSQWQQFHNHRALMNGVRQIAFRRQGYALSDTVPYERHYFEGTSPGGWSAPEHQKKLSLRRFDPAGGQEEGGPANAEGPAAVDSPAGVESPAGVDSPAAAGGGGCPFTAE